jgi:hypothetical protein
MSRDPALGDDTGPSRARDLFARASDSLDHGMAFRLRRARAQAQQPARRKPAFSALVPAGVAAAAALALGIAWWLPPPAPTAAPALSDQQEIDLLLASDEDPELYAWLADAPVATGGEMP